ncbi:MAG: BREX-1 system adenine-specific DNA-methyltransferase PglX, partial [Clostridiaceae bacterium]|nr:BREX-1 system adenine-specific DNA-methyltransferase PglX [Clostridiaceae bacterium]
METLVLKNFAIDAREQLLKHLSTQVERHDLTTKFNKNQIETLACQWFIRLIVLRFLEVNNYQPGDLKVLSLDQDEGSNKVKVARLAALELDFTPSENQLLWDLVKRNDSQSIDKFHCFILLRQCQKLAQIFPEIFGIEESFQSQLFDLSFYDPKGVIQRLINDIPRCYFDVNSDCGQVEIIGWLFQYYNTAARQEIIDVFKSRTITKEFIPAATQLFTPDWVVRYMVDNSLGRYWLERHPQSYLKSSLTYLMPAPLREIDEDIKPEEIKVFDNAMGTGHCLLYAFDVMMDIYSSCGYPSAEAARKILQYNLFGLDIDPLAYQLAHFSLLMKARKYDDLLFEKNIPTNLAYFEDTLGIELWSFFNHFRTNIVQQLGEYRVKKAEMQLSYLVECFHNARETGSVTVLEVVNFEITERYLKLISQVEQTCSKYTELLDLLKRIVKIGRLLTQRYHVVVTNPPYLNKFDKTFKKYILSHYPDFKSDLFSVFIYKNVNLCCSGGYAGYMTPFVWMFISSYLALRRYLLEEKHLVYLIQMEYSALKDATVPICAFILQNTKQDKPGEYIRLSDFRGGMDVQKEKVLEAINNPDCGYYYRTNESIFKKLPGMPIAYWAGSPVIEAYKNGVLMKEVVEARQGMATTNNDRFVRLWHEVDRADICFQAPSAAAAEDSGRKWFPYNKGGERRQWYGNYDFVVNWKNDGREVKAYKKRPGCRPTGVPNEKYYFREAITWSLIGSSSFAIRYRQPGSIPDVAGMSAFSENHEELLYVLGLMGSKVSNYILQMLNPTINMQVGNFNNFPVLRCAANVEVTNLVRNNVKIAKFDWDTFETSWDFEINPLVSLGHYLEKAEQCIPGIVAKTGQNLPAQIPLEKLRESYRLRKINVSQSFELYKNITNAVYAQLKSNEERLNEIFIDCYNLSEVMDDRLNHSDITLTYIFDDNLSIDETFNGNRYVLTKLDVVKQLISYGVGCIFGRYSLAEPGLIYTGGTWNLQRYGEFLPVKDNVVPIFGSSDEWGDL